MDITSVWILPAERRPKMSYHRISTRGWSCGDDKKMSESDIKNMYGIISNIFLAQKKTTFFLTQDSSTQTTHNKFCAFYWRLFKSLLIPYILKVTIAKISIKTILAKNA